MYILLINDNLHGYVNEIVDILNKNFNYVRVKNNTINNTYIKFHSELYEDQYVHNHIRSIFKAISDKHGVLCDYLLYKELTKKQTLFPF
jgi:hypothetical protein